MRYLTIIYVLFLPFILQAQFNLNGVVYNQSGEKLDFATVFLMGTEYASSTQSDGKYELKNIKPGNYQLKVSFIGYQSYTETIEINSNHVKDIVLKGEIFQLDAVEIQANRVGETSPFTNQNLNKEILQKENLGMDVPYILQWTPSMVVSSDGGTGIGYTGLRLRGSDQTRINVSMNGVPINDAESQNVFWVDLPDLMGSVSNIQIQRGVGTSTSGVGAFGGSISINTNDVRINPYIDLASTLGSFHTRKLSAKMGTGLLNNRYTVDARYSAISSDGYVDRATSDLRSLSFSASRLTEKSSIRLNILNGKERTYQAWYGVPQSKVNNDLGALNSHYNNNLGGIYKSTLDSIHLFSSDRRYNYYTYENQVDDYNQTHIQLLHAVSINKKINIKNTLFYTKGKGYFEEYKYQDKFANYNLSNQPDGNGNVTENSNIIRRRWLNNDFYGCMMDATISLGKMMNLQGGISANNYVGSHFGNVLSSSIPIENLDITHKYYDNMGKKSDLSSYIRSIFNFANGLSFHADLQLRNVNYSIEGIDNDLRNVKLSDQFLFFNPKFGINYSIKSNQKAYLSWAISNKEPSRSDYVDHAFIQLPKAENLNNLEMGYSFLGKKTRVESNIYFMKYKNQLVNSGELNDVGAPLRINVPDSYRLGWELAITEQVLPWIAIHGNVTLSKNKVATFNEVIYDYTSGYDIEEIAHQDTDISFSPSTISSFQILLKPRSNLEIEVSSKYVSKQYLDNTSDEARSLPAFHYENIRVTWSIASKYWKNASMTLLANNVLNRKFSSNGYTYSYRYGELITENFLYPQAGTHFMLGAKLGL